MTAKGAAASAALSPSPKAASGASYADLYASGGGAKQGSGLARDVRAAGLEGWLASPIELPVLPVAAASQLPEGILAPYRIAGAIEAVFVDGHFAADRSRLQDARPGLVTPLADALKQPNELLELHLGRHAGSEGASALNAAFLNDGAVVDVEPGERVAEPIHLLYVSSGAAPASQHVRTLVVAGSRSEATMVQSFVGLPGAAHTLTTAVTEVAVGRAAHVRRVALQRESLHGLHHSHLSVRQDADSSFHDTLFAIGAHRSESRALAVLDAPGAEATLNGLLLATGSQTMSCPTFVDHAKPHTTSHELYKAVLDGSARGSFVGNVKVRADAQKTNSEQQNRNLLLSTGARMDTTPQLEIHADDVKCSHGSTIGQLSKDALFFLRSRGIAAEAGRLLLTKAFAHEVIEKAPGPVRPLMDDLVTQWFACRKLHEVVH